MKIITMSNILIDTLRTIRVKHLRSKYHLRDLIQFLKYGKNAPRFMERIWIDPRDCRWILPGRRLQKTVPCNHPREVSGLVVKDWPESGLMPLKKSPKLNFCIQRWVEGKKWEETGAYEYTKNIIDQKGKFDNCRTHNDIIERYERLDQIFKEIKREEGFKSTDELTDTAFRESKGVLFHLGPDGEIFFGNSGNHRVAISLILGYKLPAMIGCVHVSALDKLPELWDR